MLIGILKIIKDDTTNREKDDLLYKLYILLLFGYRKIPEEEKDEDFKQNFKNFTKENEYDKNRLNIILKRIVKKIPVNRVKKFFEIDGLEDGLKIDGLKPDDLNLFKIPIFFIN